MASIYDNLNTLERVKSDIKTALENRGVSLDNIPFTDYSIHIDNMPVGEDLDAELDRQDILLEELDSHVDNLSDKYPAKLKSLVDGTSLDLRIPDLEGVKTIRSHAFESHHGLRSVELPESVYEIGDYAFSGCDNLTNMYVYAKTPPTLGSHSIPTTIEWIWVLDSDAYENDESWSEFRDKIVNMPGVD